MLWTFTLNNLRFKFLLTEFISKDHTIISEISKENQKPVFGKRQIHKESVLYSSMG